MTEVTDWSRYVENGALDLNDGGGIGGGAEDQPRQRGRPDVPLRGTQDPIWEAKRNSTDAFLF